jgi:hypothetical protein
MNGCLLEERRTPYALKYSPMLSHLTTTKKKRSIYLGGLVHFAKLSLRII